MTHIKPAKAPLKQKGGLFRSSYHLIHPENATLDGSEAFVNIGRLARGGLSEAGSYAEQVKRFIDTLIETHGLSETLASTLAPQIAPDSGAVPSILDYSIPGSGGTPLVDSHGMPVDLRGDSVVFCDICSKRPGFYHPKYSPIATPAEQTAADSGSVACCEPKIGNPDCPPTCETPCLPTIDDIKTPTVCSHCTDLCVPIIYAARGLSTFEMMALGEDPWTVAAQSLMQQRSCYLESMLINGTGQVDSNGHPQFGYLGGGSIRNPGGIGILKSGAPLSVGTALGLMDQALAVCNCSEAGMIHLPASVGLLASEALANSKVDYGDGMGEREILVTKSRGNVAVIGGGYDFGVGPDGCPPEPGTGWIWGTSMVNLVYGHALWVPDRPLLDYAGGTLRPGNGAVTSNTNDALVLAEQAIVPVYSRCCLFAAKVKLC